MRAWANDLHASLPDPATDFGERVRQRLRGEQVIWFTTVGVTGHRSRTRCGFYGRTTALLVYNRSDANRLTHIRRRPQVCLHFDGNGRGGDIVVLAGRAQVGLPRSGPCRCRPRPRILIAAPQNRSRYRDPSPAKNALATRPVRTSRAHPTAQ
jgi:PPOX class probable F420-dependent enzyme